MTDVERIERYVERYFQRSGCTEFPKVRRVAKALHIKQSVIEEAANSYGNLQITFFNVTWEEPLGGWYVETVSAPQ